MLSIPLSVRITRAFPLRIGACSTWGVSKSTQYSVLLKKSIPRGNVKLGAPPMALSEITARNARRRADLDDVGGKDLRDVHGAARWVLRHPGGLGQHRRHPAARHALRDDGAVSRGQVNTHQRALASAVAVQYENARIVQDVEHDVTRHAESRTRADGGRRCGGRITGHRHGRGRRIGVSVLVRRAHGQHVGPGHQHDVIDPPVGEVVGRGCHRAVDRHVGDRGRIRGAPAHGDRRSVGQRNGRGEQDFDRGRGVVSIAAAPAAPSGATTRCGERRT